MLLKRSAGSLCGSSIHLLLMAIECDNCASFTGLRFRASAIHSFGDGRSSIRFFSARIKVSHIVIGDMNNSLSLFSSTFTTFAYLYQVFFQFCQSPALAFIIRIFLNMADVPTIFLFIEYVEFHYDFLHFYFPSTYCDRSRDKHPAH